MKCTRLLTLAFFPMLCAPLFAQAPGGPPAQPPAGTPQPPHGGKDHHGHDHDRGPDRGGILGMVPPGTWWKNPDIVSRLSLTADQQTKMDEIFQQNRLQLVDLKASLDKEQINLEPLLNTNPVDTNKALAEISKIADLRAGLEKANARMLLGLRSVLTADQWTKLHTRPENGALPAGPRGPGQPGPGGPPAGPGGLEEVF